VKSFNSFTAKVFRKIGHNFLRLAAILGKRPAKLLRHGEGRNLYRTNYGDLLWLNDTGYLDRQIIENGVFEPESMLAVHRLVRPGDVVLDVGANIGYYSVRFAKLVGSAGRVIASEPVRHYRTVLERNIAENALDNVQVLDYGFSDKAATVQIEVGPSSATMHSPAGFDKVLFEESIALSRLDDKESNLGLQRLDFVKMDVDGHEPFVLRGAWNVLARYSPVILMEISHLHYFQARVFGWEFFCELREKGFRVYRESDFSEIDSVERFLRECCNFDRSANIVLSKREL